MSGVIKAVGWEQIAEELRERYKDEADVTIEKRLPVLWLARSGTSALMTAGQAGLGERTAVQWLSWYREDSLSLEWSL